MGLPKSVMRAAALAKEYHGDINRVASTMGIRPRSVRWYLSQHHAEMCRKAEHARAGKAVKNAQRRKARTAKKEATIDSPTAVPVPVNMDGIRRVVELVQEINELSPDFRYIIRSLI